MKISNATASHNILRYADEGRLVQNKWHDTAKDGREIACLLGSMHPMVKRAADCNGDLMPMWLAELTPVLFDGIPATDANAIGRRYGELVGRWHVLSPQAWQAVLVKFLVKVIDGAVDAARPVCTGKDYWPAVEAACGQCKSAIESGDKDAAARAADAAYAAADAAYAAAYAAARAARAADAAYAAYAAARAARAADAAYAAYAAARAARAADAAARAADAHLRLFNFLLDQIEIAVKAAE